MAGLAAAWRLSEPGWQDELESITVYQRGWRLGGKGASSRGANGRIEEHGLHLWLGYYENAFRLLRECYAELDRPATDPEAPIRTWRDAMIPAGTVGLEDRRADGWHHWLGSVHAERPAARRAGGHGRTSYTLTDVLRRALAAVVDFLESLPDDDTRPATWWSACHPKRPGGTGGRRRRCGTRRSPRCSRRPLRCGEGSTAPAWPRRWRRSTARSRPPTRRCAT